MTDLEADSKGHESDDERSVSASNDFVPGKSERGDTVGKGDESETRSRTESKRSAASERDSHRSDTIGKDDESETKSRTESKRSEHEESDEHSSDDTLVDDEAKDVKHKEHRKGNKAFHALRNDQLDKVIDEYKSQFSKPESIGDAASMHSAMQQDHSEESSINAAPQQTSVNDLVIDEFKQRFGTDQDQHSDQYSGSKGDDHHSEKTPSEIIEKLFKDEDLESKNTEIGEEAHKGTNLSEEETPVFSNSPKVYESSLGECKTSNTSDVCAQIFAGDKLNENVPSESEQSIRTGTLEQGESDIPSTDFGEKPIEEDELDEMDKRDAEQKRQPEYSVGPYDEYKNQEQMEVAAKQKPIRDIVQQFGGSTGGYKRSPQAGTAATKTQVQKDRPVPNIAANYVKTVSTTKTVKPRESAYKELGFANDQPEKNDADASEVSEVSNEKEPVEESNVDERYMSVRVVRSVRDYIKKKEGIELMERIKQQQQAEMEKKSHGEGKNTHFNMKTARIVKEVGVQAEVDAERDHKGTFEGDEYDASTSSELEHPIKITPVSQRIKIYQHKVGTHSSKH